MVTKIKSVKQRPQCQKHSYFKELIRLDIELLIWIWLPAIATRVLKLYPHDKIVRMDKQWKLKLNLNRNRKLIFKLKITFSLSLTIIIIRMQFGTLWRRYQCSASASVRRAIVRGNREWMWGSVGGEVITHVNILKFGSLRVDPRLSPKQWTKSILWQSYSKWYVMILS